MSLLDRVRRTIERHRLATPSTRVVAALSGGPDSVALVHILRALADTGELRLVAAAHLNHQLRSAADRDEQFCVDLAARLDLPLVIERVDVQAQAAADRRSIEDAAHRARYALFARAAALHGADVVALGHTLDDQAETVLMRLLRGAGTRGLAAMHPRHDGIIRPFIDCRRDELAAYLRDHDLACVHDETNDDVGIPRNRVRAELLPLLERRFNPNIAQVLATEATLAQAEHEYLETLAADWERAHGQPGDPGLWRAERDALAALPVALARRVLYRALERTSGGRLIGFADVERALAVVAGDTPGFDAPGQRVERVGRDVVLRGGAPGSGRNGRGTNVVSPFCYPLPVPGETTVSEIGAAVSAEVVAADRVPTEAPDTAVVARDRVAGGLRVRNRRPGDRLRPSAVGHRKLQDLLVDLKVPRGERDRVPLVVDADDRIVWVAGHVVDRDFRVTDPAQAVLVLRLKAVGGAF